VHAVRNIWDDEQLLAALREAMEADESVPPEFIELGKNAYAWHNIDAELAQLTYDSIHEPDHALSLRAEAASIRALTFTSAHLTIELEVSEDSVLGQVIPAQSGAIEIEGREGTTASTEADEVGCFLIRPIPDSPFRLRFRTADGSDILTGSITL
jgi:hypothetical protein